MKTKLLIQLFIKKYIYVIPLYYYFPSFYLIYIPNRFKQTLSCYVLLYIIDYFNFIIIILFLIIYIAFCLLPFLYIFIKHVHFICFNDELYY